MINNYDIRQGNWVCTPYSWRSTHDSKPDTDREVLGIHKDNGRVLTNFYPRIKCWRHGFAITHWCDIPAIDVDVDKSRWKYFKEAPKGGECYE